MFDIGFLELVIVGIIALLVLGPERLPSAARSAGRWAGKARRMMSSVSQEIDRQIEIDELRERLKKQGHELDLDFDVNHEANQIHRTVSEALKDSQNTHDDPKAEHSNTEPSKQAQAKQAPLDD